MTSILQEPIEVKTSVVRCGEGENPLNHPVVYLNLGEEGETTCPYCSKYYVKRRHSRERKARTDTPSKS